MEVIETINKTNNSKMKHIKLFEQFIAEKREAVGKYNTVKKAMKAIKNEYGPTPTVQSVASFINDNYYDVTEVERGDDDPSANDKIADLIASYKFDIEEWEIAWEDAQNESAMIEALSKSDRKAIAYTMADQDPSKIKDLQNAIGQDFSDNYSSTNRSVLVDVKKKGGKWVAITSETESEYNNKKPKKGKREATIGITWNAMFF